MATFILTNNVRVGTARHFAGEILNDVVDDVAEFTRAGAVLVATGTPAIDDAAALARKLVLKGAAADSPEVIEGLVAAAVRASTSGDAAAAQATADAAVPLATVQTAQVTLVGGAATESTLNYTANSRVIPIRNTAAGTPGDLSVGTVTPGSPGSADIASASGTDTSTVTVLVIG